MGNSHDGVEIVLKNQCLHMDFSNSVTGIIMPAGTRNLKDL